MSDLLKKLNEFDRHTLFLASTPDQKIILEAYAKSGHFFDFKLKHPHYLRPRISDDYLLFMKIKYQFDPNVANSIVGAFSCIDALANSSNAKINRLAVIKHDLIKSGKLSFPNINAENCHRIILINRCMIPEFSKEIPTETLFIEEPVFNPAFKFEAKNKDEEYQLIFHEVIRLLENRAKPGQIKIINSTIMDDYQLKKRFKAANIPLTMKKLRVLSEHPLAIEFMHEAVHSGLNHAVKWLLATIATKAEQDEVIARKIVQIINNYSIEDLNENLDLLQYEFDTATYMEPFLENAVTITEIQDLDFGQLNNYLVMNANDESLPAKAIDNDYLSDQEKSSIGLLTSIDSNIEKMTILGDLFSRVRNLSFFYACEEEGNEKRFTDLIFSRPVISKPLESSFFGISYAPKYDFITYAKLRYNLETYGVESEAYARFDATFRNEYAFYNPQFQGLKKTTVDKLIADRIHISASSLKLFNECPFHFLLDQLLKVNPNENSLPIFFGNLTHMILDQISDDKQFDLDSLISQHSGGFPEEIGYKQEIFLEIYAKQTRIIRDYLFDFDQFTKFRTFGNEWSYSYPYDDDRRFVVTGKIDKILTLEDAGTTKAVVIDYKTGNTSYKQEEFESGSSVQLPFYLHLMSKNPDTAHLDPIGFFYQKVQLGRYKAEKNLDPILKILRLNGIIIEDKNAIADLADEKWLQGIRFKQDGSLAKSNRIITKSDMDAILALTECFIDDAVAKIKAGDFAIKPFPPEKNMRISRSCEYCQNSAICHLQSLLPEIDYSEEEDNDD